MRGAREMIDGRIDRAEHYYGEGVKGEVGENRNDKPGRTIEELFEEQSRIQQENGDVTAGEEYDDGNRAHCGEKKLVENRLADTVLGDQETESADCEDRTEPGHD